MTKPLDKLLTFLLAAFFERRFSLEPSLCRRRIKLCNLRQTLFQRCVGASDECVADLDAVPAGLDAEVKRLFRLDVTRRENDHGKSIWRLLTLPLCLGSFDPPHEVVGKARECLFERPAGFAGAFAFGGKRLTDGTDGDRACPPLQAALVKMKDLPGEWVTISGGNIARRRRHN